MIVRQRYEEAKEGCLHEVTCSAAGVRQRYMAKFRVGEYSSIAAVTVTV